MARKFHRQGEQWRDIENPGLATGVFSPASAYRSAVLFGVFFCRVLVVLGGMQLMTVSDLRVMCGLLVRAGLMMFGRFAMMHCRLLVMMRGLFMVLVDVVVRHRCLPGL